MTALYTPKFRHSPRLVSDRTRTRSTKMISAAPAGDTTRPARSNARKISPPRAVERGHPNFASTKFDVTRSIPAPARPNFTERKPPLRVVVAHQPHRRVVIRDGRCALLSIEPDSVVLGPVFASRFSSGASEGGQASWL
ncbi:MAG TPA: hypothetical protein VLC09_19575 [Polyangiaceae bacterium]|nr:hypothetical protein [Polyangiaceae bacterium]